LTVMKFGGSSLAAPSGMRRVGDIIERHAREHRVAVVVSALGDVGMLTVSGGSLVGKPGMAAKILGLLAAQKINILMISQSVSESKISIVVKRNLLEGAKAALESSMADGEYGLRIDTEKHVSVVAAVGAGMKGTPGVAARVFGAVARQGINVRMLAQGSSELNISFVVRDRDAAKAVMAIHRELVLTR
jgi:aspartate kinase